MKKIGILTLLYNNYNYGGVLQAYALARFICGLGYEAKVVLYSGENNVVYQSRKDKLSQYSVGEIAKRLLLKVESKLAGRKIQDIINKRKELILRFEKENIPCTSVFSDEDLGLLDEQFDYFVSGSDQVWNPNCAFLLFLQGFTENDGKKISYAASISRSVLSEHERNVLIPYISRFKAVSVREKTAKKLLTDCGIKSVEVVVDPTFLITKQEWESLLGTSKARRKYVFCYFFSDSIKYREKIYNFCKDKNLDLLYLPYAKQVYVSTDNAGRGERINEAGPIEFLKLIHDAEYVFTDSFHGVALSINFEKQFFAFKRDKKNSAASMNSRIYDVLDLFGLSDRLIDSNDNIDDTSKKIIDYDKVQTVLNDQRLKAEVFLRNSFS